MIRDLLNSIPFVQSYFEGIATIFMLHRVHPLENSRLSANENMKVSPEFLEKFIIELKSKGYEFISLDRLYEILMNGEKVKKQVVFTLDDGYLDNYTYAYPIFKKYNIPFTIYITTSFPEKKAVLWWYIIEDLILENDFLKLSDGRIYECKTKQQKESVFLKVREIILRFSKENFIDSLNQLFCHYEIDWLAKNQKLCLNWEHIINLSKDDLCTIGGHTKNHYTLNRLSVEEVENEIMEANRLIEEKIGKKVEHFAYPFGSRNEVGQREFNIVKNLGLKTATTTRRGTIYPQHKEFLECLPRIMLTENFDIKTVSDVRRKKVVTL